MNYEDPFKQSPKQLPHMAAGGLAELSMFYSQVKQQLLRDLLSESSDAEIVRRVRQYQGMDALVTSLKNKVKEENEDG